MEAEKTYILNLETSSTVCSVSVSLNGKTVLLKEENSGYTHAENLHLFIQEVIRNSGITLKHISAVAVGMGPGSYTGLRIGMSAAKGLCYALNIPLIGISTLQLMTQQVKEENNFSSGTYFCPLIDARRMEVYYSILDNSLAEIEIASAKIITTESVTDWKKYPEIIFFGSGMPKSKLILSSALNNPLFIENIMPSAKWMEELSHLKFLNRDFENIAYAEPEYGKEFYTGGA